MSTLAQLLAANVAAEEEKRIERAKYDTEREIRQTAHRRRQAGEFTDRIFRQIS